MPRVFWRGKWAGRRQAGATVADRARGRRYGNAQGRRQGSVDRKETEHDRDD